MYLINEYNYNVKNVLFIMPFGAKTIYNKIEKQSFVFDFDLKFLEWYKMIEKDKNYSIYKVDSLIGTDIYNKMYKAIQSAHIVVADITNLNPNVMYELGVRHTLKDKTTILIKHPDYKDNYPFDINTSATYNYDIFEKQWKEFFSSNVKDSPILKEIIIGENDSTYFKKYENKWLSFKKKYNKKKNINVKYKFLNDNLSFEGLEEFDQLMAFINYKVNNNQKGLLKSWDIISKHNPENSSNIETIGLACSISRKIYDNTSNIEWGNIAFDLSRYFLFKFKTPYSYSSYILCLVSFIENEDNHINLSYLKIESKLLLDFSKRNIPLKEEEVWYKDTENLLEYIINERNITIDNFDNENSKDYFKRIEKILSKERS